MAHRRLFITRDTSQGVALVHGLGLSARLLPHGVSHDILGAHSMAYALQEARGLLELLGSSRSPGVKMFGCRLGLGVISGPMHAKVNPPFQDWWYRFTVGSMKYNAPFMPCLPMRRTVKQHRNSMSNGVRENTVCKIERSQIPTSLHTTVRYNFHRLSV